MTHKNTPIWNFYLWIILGSHGHPIASKLERVAKADDAETIIYALEKGTQFEYVFRLEIRNWNGNDLIHPSLIPDLESVLEGHFEKNGYTTLEFKMKEKN